jgi:hypothetical protein
MGASNKVVAGDYLNQTVIASFSSISIMKGFSTTISLDKTTVADYEIVDQTKQKSAASAIGRGLVGGFVLGPVGLLAGLSAKSKGTHMIAIQFKDGKKSLIEIDDKIYSALVKKLF